MLAGPGKVIKQSGFAGVGIAGQGNGDRNIHGQCRKALKLAKSVQVLVACWREAERGGQPSEIQRFILPGGCYCRGPVHWLPVRLVVLGKVLATGEQVESEPQPEQPQPQEIFLGLRSVFHRRKPIKISAPVTARKTIIFCITPQRAFQVATSQSLEFRLALPGYWLRWEHRD